MTARTITHGTFTIERRYKQPIAKVFRAYSDPDKKRRWFAEGPGFHLESYELDFREEGFERSRFRFMADKSIAEGTPCTNDTIFLDIVPDQRIVFAYTMLMNGKRFSSSHSSVEFLPEGSGTMMVFTEQAAFFEDADGIEMREQGTRELLDSLARELGE